MVNIRITSFNVKGLRKEIKRRKIFHYLHELKIDIALLQETHSTIHDEKFWTAEWGGKIFFSHGESNARGVAILIKKNIGASFGPIYVDHDGRVVSVAISVDGIDFSCTSVYSPNIDNEKFFAEAFVESEKIPGRRIFSGDFNTVLDISKDMKGGKGYSHTKSTNFINEYINEHGLVDIWRKQHPDEFKSTFIQRQGAKASLLMERIDYILIDSSLQQFVKNSKIMPAFISDHANPIIELQCSVSPPGSGYWKLNVKLLEDDKFIQDAIKRMTDTLSDVSIDIFERWELMKFSVKQAAIIRGSEISKSDKYKLDALSKKLQDIVDQRDKLDLADDTPMTVIFDDHSTQILKIQEEIDTILTKKTETAMMKCKANWYEFAEKSSKYFHALEKSKYNKKTIHRIKNDQGDIVDDPKEILNILNQYYTRLFSDKNSDPDPDYLALLNIPQVNEKDKYWLDADIQLEEIHLALKSMNKNKCPGTDGLPVEFYLKFWPILATTIHRLFQTIVERRELNRSAKESVTSLMDKPSKDPLIVMNWRPLSLLNTDYKLYAKVLARRMATPAEYLLSNDQKGFMKNRSIIDNLMNLLTVVDFCDKMQLDSLLIAIDFSSAFDSCSWSAMKQVLIAYGYGDRFINMIMTCYYDIKTAVMNNNTWTKWIKLNSGVRQGCPLSGILFNHLISIIEMKIKQNPEIKGIQIHNLPPKLLDMFADDIWNVILYDKDIFEELMFEYSEFESFSGLAINYNKTEIMRMGSIRSSDAKFYSHLPLHWSDGPVKILGVNIYSSWLDTSLNNYQEIFNKANAMFDSWKCRSLTPIGKIQIINSIANSFFMYKLQVLMSPPAKDLVKYKRMITQFLWDNRRSKISYDRLIASFSQGGLQLRDLSLINTAIKMNRMYQILDDKYEAYWKNIIAQIHFRENASYLLQCNMSRNDIVKHVPDSYLKEMLMIWAPFNYTDPTSVNDILAQKLWYNSHIKIRTKWLFYVTLYENGITKIIDLFDLDTGRFYDYEQFCLEYGNNLVDYLTYYGIISAIPTEWRNILKKNLPSPLSEKWLDQFNLLCSKGKPIKVIYSHFRDSKAKDNSTLILLWQNDLRTNIDKKKFGKLFINLKKITTSTKLRYFQYKILVRALTLNLHVSKWNPEISALCTFCDSSYETTIHFFVECTYVKKLWSAVIKWLNYHNQIKVSFSPMNIVFNNYSGPHCELVNMYILITKFYIYRARVQKSKLNFSHLIAEIFKNQNIERTIARLLGKQRYFSYKWNDYN